MLRIKRLYLFMLQTFLPLFMMTFFICLFIVLMQFLWKYVDELVGKGLEVSVVAELFFYAALTMIPLALPLAILLASLMVFGNLGEKFELTAMKSAGVSLVRIMAPLIIFVSCISVGAFFFQNDILPKAQVKMWTLMFSMRQKSPELDIPEGSFYEQISGYNIYVKTKDRETGTLHDMMIYDVSQGFGTANIIVADSGKLSFTEDKMHLFLKLFNGESFEDLRSSTGASNRSGVLYRRETFDTKDILIPFDANFNRLDDKTMKNQYIGKNISELTQTIDSVNIRIDSIGNVYGRQVCYNPYFGLQKERTITRDGVVVREKNMPVVLKTPVDVDSLFNSGGISARRNCISTALLKAERLKQDYLYKGYVMEDDLKTIRRHKIELQKKFTLAFACLIFFFIGAPLGSIIRKGGLAIPIVVSVLLFVVYYIIDNTGLKLAKEGIWEVWNGVWLSTFVLAPLGVFLTYKAAKDSAVFNPDAYMNFFRKIIGKHELRNIQMKEIVMDDVVISDALNSIDSLETNCNAFLTRYSKRQGYVQYWLNGYSRTAINNIREELDSFVEYMSNSKNILVINKLMDYPVIRKLFFYHPTNYRAAAWTAIIVFPVGILGYMIGLKQQGYLKKDIKNVLNVNKEIKKLLEKEINDKSENNDNGRD